jgi:methanogenic corrinoid protein MtbC1
VAEPAAPAVIGLPEAADRLGVHYMTAYRYVRTGRLPASLAAGVWQVDPADVQALTESGRSSPRRRGGARAEAASQFSQRLLDGDESGAAELCEDSLASWATPVDLYTEMVIPALKDIGRRWAAGELSVADEHRAAAVVIRVMGRLGPHFAHPGRRRGTIVIGAPAGDRHSIPVMVVGDLLRDAGFTVVDLGADTPPQSFVEAARKADRLLAVGIGATLSANESAVAAAITSVHEAFPGLLVIAGGSGLPSLAAAERLGADRWTGSGWEALVRAATEIDAGVRPTP